MPPPTGRIVRRSSTSPRPCSTWPRPGPIASQSDGVAKLLHSDQTMIHLVIPARRPCPCRKPPTPSTNSPRPTSASAPSSSTGPAPSTSPSRITTTTAALIDADAVRTGLGATDLAISEEELAGLVAEAVDYAAILHAQEDCASELDKVDVPRLHLPALTGGIDLGALYELAAHLQEQGVR